MSIEELKLILEREQCSCVISNGDNTTICRGRGVSDLFRLLKTQPEILRGASLADKVVGKGAAALMILGGVREVYASTMSKPAMALLESAATQVSFGKLVDNIINRTGTDICPVEKLCSDCTSAEECLPLIENFINQQKTK